MIDGMQDPVQAPPPSGPSEQRRRTPRLVALWRWAGHIFTSYPLGLERYALASLRALSAGPRTLKVLAAEVFAHVHGPKAAIADAHREDAQQAFLQLVQLGAIACKTVRRGDGTWDTVMITPLGVEILTNPDDWFDAGHLRRAARNRASR